jgi:hypothetical protein
MTKFEIRTFKKGDKFYSEYEHNNYDKNTIMGKFWNILGRTEKFKSTKMTCALDGNFDFYSYINEFLSNESKNDQQLITVCLMKDKIVGIMFFELDLDCTLEKNCFDLIILNPYLCFEKKILHSEDIVDFIKKSMTIVEKHYKPYYEKIRKIIQTDPKYKNIELFDMYISLTRDQVPEFSNNIYKIYVKAGFDDKQRHGMMFYNFTNKRSELYKKWLKEFKDMQKNKSRSRSRSRSRKGDMN